MKTAVCYIDYYLDPEGVGECAFSFRAGGLTAGGAKTYCPPDDKPNCFVGRFKVFRSLANDCEVAVRGSALRKNAVISECGG